MTQTITLHGYRYSVYNRIARMALHEKQLDYARVEVDPFAPDLHASYLNLHPFGRVPVLCHGAFVLYETVAITRYIDAGFDGPFLTPIEPRAIARMSQCISIIDSYGYWPMVRQVFSHRVFRPLQGEPSSEEEIHKGLAAARKVLAALDRLAAEGLILDVARITLADCHLAPMIDYFVRAEEGAEALAAFGALSKWWSRASRLPSLAETDPGIASGTAV
jgi:glutathione S-transferase